MHHCTRHVETGSGGVGPFPGAIFNNATLFRQVRDRVADRTRPAQINLYISNNGPTREFPSNVPRSRRELCLAFRGVTVFNYQHNSITYSLSLAAPFLGRRSLPAEDKGRPGSRRRRGCGSIA